MSQIGFFDDEVPLMKPKTQEEEYAEYITSKKWKEWKENKDD